MGQSRRGGVDAMLKKVLVAYDGSSAAQKALELAALIAENRPMLVTVLTVVEGETEADEETQSARQQEAQRLAEQAQGRFSTVGCNIEAEVRVGPVADTILDLARDGNYDLIVLGDKGRAGLVSFFLGTTAYQVSRRAPCSVVLAK